jgi:hypothetical protein
VLVFRSVITGLLAALLSCSDALADELIGEYRAFISENDLYNSAGNRLSEPWQVIRQDRANYHQFERRDPEDQYDSFFALKRNRELLESLIREGTIYPIASRVIVGGDIYVRVKIYGSGARGDYVDVFVE